MGFGFSWDLSKKRRRQLLLLGVFFLIFCDSVLSCCANPEYSCCLKGAVVMLLDLEEKTRVLVEDIVERSAIGRGAIFVLGLSSSEVAGGTIGKASSREIGQRIVKTILEVLEAKGIYLAVQGCEHLNRALVVERELAMAKDLEIVNVLPTLHAGEVVSWLLSTI